MTRGLLIVCIVALYPAAGFGQPADYIDKFSGFWTVRFGGGDVSGLLDELPDDVVLIDDAGGGELAAGEYNGLVLSESALAAIADYDFAAELLPENSCKAPSVAFYMQAPFPMEIYAGRDLIVFKMEYFDLYRVIFLDGREHPPASAPHTLSGHSVGHWEGDTLVVDTTHIAPGTFMNNGFDHSEDLHLIERFRVSEDGTTLSATQIYEDPATFSGRAARFMSWSKRPGEYVYPYDCDPLYGG
ncbi:MAG: hypothetical protein R3305_11365 [Gammaproteobacteria bacterium]|nr:hypothetical protein [Gammaproteobacteria bacterium]